MSCINNSNNVDLYAIYYCYGRGGYYYSFYVKCFAEDPLDELTRAIIDNKELRDSAIWTFEHTYAASPTPSIIQLYNFIIENLANEHYEFNITYQKIVPGRSCHFGGGKVILE